MSESKIPVEYYNQTVESKSITSKWWTQPDNNIHESLFPLVQRLIEAQSYRSEMNLRYARLYQNMEITSLKAGHYARVPDLKAFMANRMTYNVIKSCIDSAAAKISKEKPRPIFLTENGSWSLQQKAKRLTQFIQGIFADIGTGTGDNKSLYGLGRQCFKDAEIFGTGATYFFEDGDEIKAERSMIDEIIVDDLEGMHGSPRQIHRFRQMNRDVLMALYPKKAQFIKGVETTASQNLCAYMGTDLVDVTESWHLPSGKMASDGKHVICISNCTLHAEKYEDDYFPILFQRWSNKTLGFFGSGLAEELVGIQLEINKILRTIQISQHLVAVPQVWLQALNKTPPGSINNEIGGVKYYQDKPPIFFTPTAQNPEVYNHLERLYQRAYEITGISQLSASGTKPAGVDAAVALRELQSIENERFSMQQAMYEDYFMDATTLIFKMCEKLMKAGKDPVVQFKDGNTMKTLRFSDVYIGKEKFSVRAYPTNFLPSTPAGKLQTVTELIQAGFYTKEEAQELLDYPDLKKAQNIKTAQRDCSIKVIEQIIEDEVYQSPEPYMDLDLTLPLAQSYYLRARCDDAPQNVLELLQVFIADVKMQISLRDNSNNPAGQAPEIDPQQQQQQPAQDPMMGAAPTGDPMALPAALPTSLAAAPEGLPVINNNIAA